MGTNMKVARRAAICVSAAALGAAMMVSSRDAAAQVVVQGGVTVGGTYAAPPPVAYQQPVVYQQPAVVYQRPVIYQQPMVLQRPIGRRGNVGRFRYGIDAGAGWQWMDRLSGFNLNASMRLGWQINDQLAVYYQTDIPIGLVAGGGSSGASVIWGNAVMFEYTLNDFLSFGVGPSADIGLGGVAGVGAAGTFFGIQSRIAFNLVPSVESNPYRRGGFRVGLGGHTTFMDTILVQSLSIMLGWELM